MSYLGQKYDRGIVVQRSEEGSAYQEVVEATIDGETEINASVPGGIKKLNLTSSGGGDIAKIEVADITQLTSEQCEALNCGDIVVEKWEDEEGEASEEYVAYTVAYKTDSALGLITATVNGNSAFYYVKEDDTWALDEEINKEITPVYANPELEGDENNLTSVEIDGTKYKVDGGTDVVANPTLVGTEANLTGLQVGDTKYKVANSADDDTWSVLDAIGGITYDPERQWNVGWDVNIHIGPTNRLIINGKDDFIITLDQDENATSKIYSVIIPYADGTPFLYLELYPYNSNTGAITGTLEVNGAASVSANGQMNEMPIGEVLHFRDAVYEDNTIDFTEGDIDDILSFGQRIKRKMFVTHYNYNSGYMITEEISLTDEQIHSLVYGYVTAPTWVRVETHDS